MRLHAGVNPQAQLRLINPRRKQPPTRVARAGRRTRRGGAPRGGGGPLSPPPRRGRSRRRRPSRRARDRQGARGGPIAAGWTREPARATPPLTAGRARGFRHQCHGLRHCRGQCHGHRCFRPRPRAPPARRGAAAQTPRSSPRGPSRAQRHTATVASIKRVKSNCGTFHILGCPGPPLRSPPAVHRRSQGGFIPRRRLPGGSACPDARKTAAQSAPP